MSEMNLLFLLLCAHVRDFPGLGQKIRATFFQTATSTARCATRSTSGLRPGLPRTSSTRSSTRPSSRMKTRRRTAQGDTRLEILIFLPQLGGPVCWVIVMIQRSPHGHGFSPCKPLGRHHKSLSGYFVFAFL